jgi:hypothetical protein
VGQAVAVARAVDASAGRGSRDARRCCAAAHLGRIECAVAETTQIGGGLAEIPTWCEIVVIVGVGERQLTVDSSWSKRQPPSSRVANSTALKHKIDPQKATISKAWLCSIRIASIDCTKWKCAQLLLRVIMAISCEKSIHALEPDATH